jgi:ATP-dependent Clp protease ATP-binding subunit ClpA
MFGARPVKRLISQYFETPIADLIVRQGLPGPVVITGSEPWLRAGVAS